MIPLAVGLHRPRTVEGPPTPEPTIRFTSKKWSNSATKLVEGEGSKNLVAKILLKQWKVLPHRNPQSYSLHALCTYTDLNAPQIMGRRGTACTRIMNQRLNILESKKGAAGECANILEG